MNSGARLLPDPASRNPLAAPGFDILVAVSAARQAATPTASALHSWELRTAAETLPMARRRLLTGRRSAAAARSPRFFDIDAAPSPGNSDNPGQEMNAPFTRAFQPMLNSSQVKADHPIADAVESNRKWKNHD